MASFDKKAGKWKEKIVHEMVEYWVNVVYLALVFSAFAQYRRFLLAAYDIEYTDYGVALIQALIFAKIIAIGSVIPLARALEHKPLIFPTLYKTVVFSILAGVFTVIEHAVKNLWNGRGFTGGFEHFFEKDFHEVLAGSLVIFVAVIPFFAFKELGRVFGDKSSIAALFFLKRTDQ